MLLSNWMLRVVWVAAACVSLASTAPVSAGASSSDNYDDNVRDSDLWDVHIEASGLVTETNQRLQYTSGGMSENQENVGRYTLKQPLPYSQAWVAILEVHVGTYEGVSLDEAIYGMCITVVNSSDVDDILWLGLTRERGQQMWSTNNETDGINGQEHNANTASESGRVKLSWDGSSSFTGDYDEGSGWQEFAPINVGAWGMGIGSTFTLSVGGADEYCGFVLNDGTKTYADNFVLVPEPATLSLFALGGLAILRQWRKASRPHPRQDQRNAP